MRHAKHLLTAFATAVFVTACMPSFQYEMNKFAYQLNIIKQISYRWIAFEGTVIDMERDALAKIEASKKIGDEQKRAYRVAEVNRTISRDPFVRAFMDYEVRWLDVLKKQAAATDSVAKKDAASKAVAEKKLEEADALRLESERIMKESKPANREEAKALVDEARGKLEEARARLDAI